MSEYCTEDDLLRYRPDILSLGETDWSNQVEEASELIDRAIESRWYRQVAEDRGIDWRSVPFDRDKLLSSDTQLNRLACYKTLELIYLYLMKNHPDDVFDRQRKLFSDMYRNELEEVLVTGLDYDWSDDGSIDSDEFRQPQIRRLQRV